MQAKSRDKPSTATARLPEPKKATLGDKEKLIASGATKKKTEYPTFDDVASDWEDSKKDDLKEKQPAH